MDPNHYRFTSSWRLHAPPDRVYAVLREPEEYPRWWPQIRRLRRVDEDSGEVVARSLLPFDLVFTAVEGFEDPVRRLLQIRLTGDLEGLCRWTVHGDGTGTLAVFEQEVALRKASLRRAGRVARPVFKANHAWMMRSGRRGLIRRLSQTGR